MPHWMRDLEEMKRCNTQGKVSDSSSSLRAMGPANGKSQKNMFQIQTRGMEEGGEEEEVSPETIRPRCVRSHSAWKRA